MVRVFRCSFLCSLSEQEVSKDIHLTTCPRVNEQRPLKAVKNAIGGRGTTALLAC